MGVQKGALKLKGKIGDIVLTETKKGFGFKKAPEIPEAVKEERRNRPQNQRTKNLNLLSGSITNGLRQHANLLINGKVYPALQKFFKKEQTLELSVLLDLIKKAEIRKDLPMSRFGVLPVLEMSVEPKKYVITGKIGNALRTGKDENCFYVQFILLVWRGDMTECTVSEQKSDWIRGDGKFPKKIVAEFKRNAKDTDYLLACKVATGVNNKGYELPAEMGIRFFGAGCLTKKGQKAFEEYYAGKKVVAEEKKTMKRNDIDDGKPRLEVEEW